MSSLVSSRLACRTDRPLLEALTTCRHEKPFGQRRAVCLEPWSHEVQAYIKADALGTYLGRRESDGHRLLLLFDGPRMVGIGCHEKTLNTPAPARYIGAIGLDLAVRGTKLSDGRSAASALMDLVLTDIQDCPEGPAFALADVHERNDPALGLFASRHFRLGSPDAKGYRPAALAL